MQHVKSTERDDRRDFVLRVSEHQKGNFKFWSSLSAEIDGAGVEALAHDLLEMDLCDFNVRAKPNTHEFTEQKLQSLEKFPRWWFDVLFRGYIQELDTNWPEFVSSAKLISTYKENEQGIRSYRAISERDIKAFMSKLCPEASPGQSNEGAQRRRGYWLPPLNEARLSFEAYIGDSVEWN